MQLYLVRHGATVGNESGVYQGWSDTALSPAGRRQCEAIRRKLERIEFDVVISSPLGRAISSAQLITGLSRDQILICEAFKEFNFGAWEGLSYREVQRQYPREWQAWCSDWQVAVLPGGENFTAFYQRIHDGWERLAEVYHSQSILLVGHAGPFRVLASILLKMPPESCWRLSFDFGCYSWFECQEGIPVFRKLNC